MTEPPVLPDEPARLQELLGLEILDAPLDPELLRITQLVSALCEMPTVLVSLIDRDRQWFAARVGLDVCETNRNVAFCAHAIAKPEQILLVEDAREDERFHDNPLVTGPPHIRFYAGQPLRMPSGLALGTLCMIDYKPRHLDARQREILATMARQVVAHLELRRTRKTAIESTALRHQLRRHESLLQRVARTEDAHGILPQLVSDVEAAFPAMQCSILLRDAEGRLHLAAAHRLPKPYTDALEGVAIGPEVGSCGTATWFGRRVVVSDIENDPLWAPYKELALGHDLRSCWSEPILRSDGTAFGAFAVYHREQHVPGPDEIEAVASAAHIAALALERGEFEHERRHNSLFLHSIIEHLPLMLQCHDAATLQLTHWNHMAEQITGMPRAMMLGSRGVEHLSTDARAARTQFMHETLANGQLVEFEEKIETPQGTRWLATKKIPVKDGDGHISHLLAISEDITERRASLGELEAARRTAEEQSEKLRAQARELGEARDAALLAARTKSEFLANMSHEIRTPMNGVLGLSELLTGTTLDADQQELVGGIHRSASALLVVINDILDLSKLESNRMTFEEQPFEFAQLVEDVIEVLRPNANAKGLRLACELAPGLLQRYAGDAGRLRQVLLNLAGNAVKFTAQGSVILSARHVEDAQHTRLRIEVRDTGIGIAPEKQASVFESFTQADNSITRRFGGTGLGLTISKRLIECMGGRIGLDSTPGEGSTFWLELPWRSVAEAPGGSPHLALVPGTSTGARDLTDMRVLIVEDNATNQMVATRVLKRAGVLVEVAGDGEEALARLERGTFDAVLMDVQMPKMDGLTATREWRKRETGDVHVCIIAMTAHAMADDRERCLEAGMDDYVSKPLRADALFAALGRARDRAGASGDDGEARAA